MNQEAIRNAAHLIGKELAAFRIKCRESGTPEGAAFLLVEEAFKRVTADLAGTLTESAMRRLKDESYAAAEREMILIDSGIVGHA